MTAPTPTPSPGPVRFVAHDVLTALGSAVVSEACGVARQTPSRWAHGRSRPRGQYEAALHVLHAALTVIRADAHLSLTPDSLRAWFICAHPDLPGSLSPAQAVSCGYRAEVLAAARAFTRTDAS